MTYAELKEVLDKLTSEQLQYEVMWSSEVGGGFVIRLDIAQEDLINPTGEGMEPVSNYADDPETLNNEEVVIEKGQALLILEDMPSYEEICAYDEQEFLSLLKKPESEERKQAIDFILNRHPIKKACAYGTEDRCAVCAYRLGDSVVFDAEKNEDKKGDAEPKVRAKIITN